MKRALLKGLGFWLMRQQKPQPADGLVMAPRHSEEQRGLGSTVTQNLTVSYILMER